MKKDKSAAAKAAKLSEGELLRQTAQHEKREDNLKFFGIIGTVIGVIGTIISMALEIGLLGLIFTVVVIVSVVSYFLGIRTRKKTEALIDTQLDDFFESELERAFGPPRRYLEDAHQPVVSGPAPSGGEALGQVPGVALL